jgi:hypothetical protein
MPELRLHSAALLLLAVSLLACPTTRQLRSAPEPSGFLGDYSRLTRGTGGGAQLLYLASDAKFASYDAVILDPVTLWGGERMAHLPKTEQQTLADLMYARLNEALAKDWKIVAAPGPGVLRIRAALTEARGSDVPLDVIATLLPPVGLLALAASLPQDTASTVGAAAAELEITDSLTGRRLIAAVDERVGARSLTGMNDQWSDVDEAFGYWSERLRVRLADLHKHH